MNDRVKLLDNSLVRQIPIAVIFVVAAIVSYPLDDIVVASTPVFVSGMVLAAVATALAVATVVPRLSERARLGELLFIIIPSLDFIAVAFLRSATGAGESVYTSLIVLPVLWLASLPGVRYIVYSTAGTVVVILSPLVLLPGTGLTTAEVVRLVVSIIVFGTVAGVINVLAGNARAKVRLAREHEVLVREEIDRAAIVQRSLLPDASVSVEGVSVAGRCLPAKSVGGDFFDWYATSDGFAITIGDVMGKGVGAGLIAAAVRASVRSAHAVDDPAEALRRASDGLSVAGDSTDVTFTTIFHARLSDGGVLRWADAGHGLSAIMRGDGQVEHLAALDVPLGLRLSDTYQTRTTTLGPDDLLVSVSDGVLDLFGGEEETIAKMVELARSQPEPAALVESLATLARQTPHDDDVTVVALRPAPVRHQQPVLA